MRRKALFQAKSRSFLTQGNRDALFLTMAITRRVRISFMARQRTALLSMSFTLGLFTASCSVNFLAPGQSSSVVGSNFRPGYSAPEPVGYVDGTKLTPGAVRAVGNQNSLQAVITLNQRKAVGVRSSGVFSIGKFRSR